MFEDSLNLSSTISVVSLCILKSNLSYMILFTSPKKTPPTFNSPPGLCFFQLSLSLQDLFSFSFVFFFVSLPPYNVKQRERYRLRVRAADKGDPSSYADVDVDLDVVDRNNKPPIWDSIVYGPIHIKENVAVNSAVASVKARLVKEIY